MNTYTVERDWTTTAGHRAVVIMTTLGHRCGYIGLPSGHPLHGVAYNENCLVFSPVSGETPISKRGLLTVLCGQNRLSSPEMVFDVHGGLTYSGGKDDYPVPSAGLWWFGYDCRHAGDRPSDEYCTQQREKYPDKPYMWQDHDGEHRTLAYCISECERLAAQIKEATQ